MIKKYGWKYTLATISCFLLSFYWPLGFFICYMFKDEQDELKRKLIKKLNFATWCWVSLEFAACLAKIISLLIEKYYA